jgi:hypothetical protein
MITLLTLRNFKSIGEQTYDFGQFDLLVGRNNSGKSTVLQALAIWQFCIDEFHRSKRAGSKGIQVILPNFTALPLPEFNLLWKDRTDRQYPVVDGKKKQQYILIEIIVTWTGQNATLHKFGVELRYHSPQAIYAIPADGWDSFRQFEEQKQLPTIVYVPPFSGLEPTEERRDDAPVRQQVGKAQPGSVLRNLLLRVCPPPKRDGNTVSKEREPPQDWVEIKTVVERWFSVNLQEPKYEQDVDVLIKVEYSQNNKTFDIIAGGSGFHQTLTLLAFFYGYQPTTILLDEPDAHLHVNLQREILDYFKQKSAERNVQFLIATHAEEFINGVNASQILSLLQPEPRRIQSKPETIRAMADVSNTEITGMMASPFILYLEGESDERILRAWASICGMDDVFSRLCMKVMRGGSKKTMKEVADNHFTALKQIVPEAKRLLLLDFDNEQTAFHPQDDNPNLYEWKRKNIENYLLVPDAWKKSVQRQLVIDPDDLFIQPAYQAIDRFFSDQNLTLPPGRSWKSVDANIFKVVDGKRILFENDDSLFQTLRSNDPPAELIRESVAASMSADEIHQDVHNLFIKLKQLVESDKNLS